MAAIPMVAVAAAPVSKTAPASASTECLIPHRLGSRWTTSWTDPDGFDARDDKDGVSVRMWGRGKKPKTNSKKATLGDYSSDEDRRRWTAPAPAHNNEDRRRTFGEGTPSPKKKRYSFMPGRTAPAPPPEAPAADSAEAAHASALAKLTGSPSAQPTSSPERKKRRFSLKSLPARPPTPEALPPAPPLLSLKDVKGGMSFAAESKGKRGWGEYDPFGAVREVERDKFPKKGGDVTPPKSNPFDGGFTPVSPNLGEERRAKRLSRLATGERALPPPLPAPVDMIAATSPGLSAEQRAARHRSAPVGRPVTRTLRRKPPPKADDDLLQSESGHSGHTTPPGPPGAGAGASGVTAAPAGESVAAPAAGAAAAAVLGAAAFAARPLSGVPSATLENPSPAVLGAAAFASEPGPVSSVPDTPEASQTTPTAATAQSVPAAASFPVAREAPVTGEEHAPDVISAALDAQPAVREATHESASVPAPQSEAVAPTTPPTRQDSASTTDSMYTAHSDSSAAVTAPSSPVDSEFSAAPTSAFAAAPAPASAPAPAAQPVTQHAAWPIFPVVPVSSLPPQRSTATSPISPASPSALAFPTQSDEDALSTPRAITPPAVQDSALLPTTATEPVAPAPAILAAHSALASAVHDPPRKPLAISTPPRRAPIPAAWQSQASLLVPGEERPSSTTPPATAESGIFPQHREEFVDARGPEGFVQPATGRSVPGAVAAGAATAIAAGAAATAHTKSSSVSSTSAASGPTQLRIKPSDIAQIPPFSPPRRAAAPMPSEYAYDRPAAHARAAESLRARHGLSPEPPEEARHLRVSAYGVPELDFTRTPPPERADEPELDAQGRSSSEREVLQTPALGADPALSGSSHSGHTQPQTQSQPSQTQYIQPTWPRSRGHSRASSASRSTTSAASAAPPSVSAFTDRLPRPGQYDGGDGGGVEGLLSAQHTGTTKDGNSSGMATVESSPRAPSWIDYARPPKVLELEAAVAAAAAAANMPFPSAQEQRLREKREKDAGMERAQDLDASTTRGSPERAARESRRYGLVGMNGHASSGSGNASANGHTRNFSGSYGNGNGKGSAHPFQPMFNPPPPPQHSPSAPPPPPKDHFGTYPPGHTYATPQPQGSVARTASPPYQGANGYGSNGAASPPYQGSLGRAAPPPFGAGRGSSRPQTADAAQHPFATAGRSSRPSTAGAPASHPFNSLRSSPPSTADNATTHPFGSVGRSQSRPGTAGDAARATSPELVPSPTQRATSPFNSAQWAKLQPISAAHASALSRLEGTSAETYSLAHEAHSQPPPSFPGARPTSPEPRKRFSFRPSTASGGNAPDKKKRFFLLPEKGRTSVDISAPVPASDAPLPADAWPAGGVGSRMSGIAQTPLPPAPAVSAMAVGARAKLSMHPDTSPHQGRDDIDIPERPASAASRRSRRWSFKPGKKARGGDDDAPPVPALPPVLPLPNSFNEAKGVNLSGSETKPAARAAVPLHRASEAEEPKKKKGGKFMRSLRGLFKH